MALLLGAGDALDRVKNVDVAAATAQVAVQLGRGQLEIELGEADCDVVFTDGAQVDLGTAIADTLALSIDPYPRSASAEAALKEAGVLSEEQASPFAVLAKLKRSES